MKPGTLVLCSIVLLGACALPASAFVYNGDLHTTVTVTDYEFWSGIPVGEGEILEYTVSVQSGMEVNVYLIHDSDLTLAISGGVVEQVKADEDTRSASQSCPTAGRYALVITNSPYTSVCKVDIVVRSANFWDTGTGRIVIVVVGLAILVAVVAAVVVLVRRRRPAPAPQYPGQPQHYPAAPPYPAAAQYPASPPPQYPVAPPAAYEAPNPAAYTPPPSPGYQAPPPPQMQPPAPQPPARPGPAGGPPVLCRYCDFQMPAGTQICPRCGGFN